jgi:large subunit ribosomal protein L9
MQVILRTDVDKVGLRGEVVDVAAGFARNFLIPRKLAERATPGRVAELAKIETRRARHEAQSFEQAQEIVQTLERTELRFDVKAGPTGTLFGSVTPTDITDELWSKAKVRVDRRKIVLAEPIKRIGRYEVPIDLFTDVTATVRTLVVPEGGELPPEEELEAMRAAEEAEARAEEEVAGDEGPTVEEAVAEIEAEEATPEEPDAEPGAADEQVPEDAFDRAADTATATETETEPR